MDKVYLSILQLYFLLLDPYLEIQYILHILIILATLKIHLMFPLLTSRLL